jgi:hypothetical protein
MWPSLGNPLQLGSRFIFIGKWFDFGQSQRYLDLLWVVSSEPSLLQRDDGSAIVTKAPD